LLAVACFGCGFFAAWSHRGWRSVRRGWPALLIMGVVMSGVQAGLALSGLWNLGGFGAGLAGLGTAALVARLPRYRRVEGDDLLPAGDSAAVPSMVAGGQPSKERRNMPLWLALAPYLFLVIVVGAAELWPWLNEVLNRVQVRVEFPQVQTAYGWTTPAGPGRTISVWGHAGALLAYVAVVFYFVYRRLGYYKPGAPRRIVGDVVRSGVPSSIGIASMVGFAVAMDNSGMTRVLAEGLSRAAGSFYPVASPFIGLLGAFMTGSNTNSNVVFAPLQQQVAGLLGVSALVILGAQTAGGALGSMVAPAKLIVGCSTAGLAGQEGRVLKRTLLPGLIITGVVGLLAWLVA
jgi:lactate permease